MDLKVPVSVVRVGVRTYPGRESGEAEHRALFFPDRSRLDSDLPESQGSAVTDWGERFVARYLCGRLHGLGVLPPIANGGTTRAALPSHGAVTVLESGR